MTSSPPCLAGFFSLCSFLLFTVWVTSANQLAKSALRGSTVLPQDFRGPPTGLSFRRVGPAQLLCISRLEGFRVRVEQIASDLELVANFKKPQVTVSQGDARLCHQVLGRRRRFHAVICSPPYPTEHDYTRNTRLELAFLEHV